MMDSEIRTLEMARLYEKQGYYADALKIYEALAKEDAAHADIQAGIDRLRPLLVRNGKEAVPDVTGDRIARLCEKWLRLMILKQRFHHFKNIKARVV